MNKYTDKVFGDLDNFIIHTNKPEDIKVGANIVVVNPDCEDEWDCVIGKFDITLYSFIVGIEILDIDKDDYYTYAKVVINEIKERGY